MITVYLNSIAAAVSEHDVHDDFVIFTGQMLSDPRRRTAFRSMVSRANIAYRYWFVDPQNGPSRFSLHDACECYRPGSFPNMLSATVMFVLLRIIQQARPGQYGCAISFGLGPTAETMHCHAV